MATLFREKAIEKMHSSDQTNEALKIISPPYWIGVVGSLITVCAFIIYFIYTQQII